MQKTIWPFSLILLLKQLKSDWFLVVSFVFSANQKPFVICTRVTEELHSFLSQSELSNFFVYIILSLTAVHSKRSGG